MNKNELTNLESKILEDIKQSHGNGVTVNYIYQAYRIPKQRARNVLESLAEKEIVVKIRSKLGYVYIENK